MVADHEGLAAAALLALVRPLVGVRPHVLLQVGPGREGLAAAALGNVAVERVACKEGRTEGLVLLEWLREWVLLYNGRTDNMWELSGDRINIVPTS